MPRKAVTAGNDPDVSVPFQFNWPLWMKRRALERAKWLGMDLGAYMRGLVTVDIGGRGEPPQSPPRPQPRPKRGKGAR